MCKVMTPSHSTLRMANKQCFTMFHDVSRIVVDHEFGNGSMRTHCTFTVDSWNLSHRAPQLAPNVVPKLLLEVTATSEAVRDSGWVDLLLDLERYPRMFPLEMGK
jgi:hypothetical protein